MIISNIYIYSCVNVCIYKYVTQPPQTKISGYTPAHTWGRVLILQDVHNGLMGLSSPTLIILLVLTLNELNC